jgi:CRP-like cAMP-binding protein
MYGRGGSDEVSKMSNHSVAPKVEVSLGAKLAKVRHDPDVPNMLLAGLPRSEYECVRAECESVKLKLRDVLHEPGEKARYVYFPSSGVISMLTLLDDGSAVEIATVGNEGMTDFAAYLGLESPARWLVQVPGEALRIRATTLRGLAERNPALLSAMHNYMLAMFILVSQTAACNRRHPVEERCARWLLMTHDRVEEDEFPMTHEFLADMLGVRRPSVSIAMSMLSRAGYIAYRRGKVRLIDRPGLEDAACHCYKVVRDVFQRRSKAPAPYLISTS